VLVDVDDDRALRILLADNRAGDLAEYDGDLLRAALEALGPDLSGTLFDEKDLGRMLGWCSDDVPTTRAGGPVHSKAGEVYELGPHRVACGDCTDGATVAALLGDVVPGLMVTDPPYGVEYDPVWREKALGAADRRAGKVKNDDRHSWEVAWRLFAGDVAYVWHASTRAGDVQRDLESAGMRPYEQLVWAKDRLAISRAHYHWQHEVCWYAVRRGKTARWAGGRAESTLWRIDRDDGDDQASHGTQKPLECMERPIRNHDHDEVYDPFLGSGTTLIACARQNRRCFGVEIDPVYVDVVRRRWTKWADEHGVDAGPGALR
jgi:DNA modification methylase